VDPGAIEESDYEQLKKELEVRSVLNAVRVHDIIVLTIACFLVYVSWPWSDAHLGTQSPQHVR
jgi:hypothetical protein